MATDTINFFLKCFHRMSIALGMNISGQAATSLLDSVLNAESTRTNIDVAMLKKAQNTQKVEGEAIVKLIEQAAPEAQGFNAFA